MNCRYREARASIEIKKRHERYGLLYLEWIDTCIGVLLAEKFGWRCVRLQKFFNHARDHTMLITGKYKPDGAWIRRGRGTRRADEGELIYDGMESAVFAMTKDLCACGLDYDVEKLRGGICTTDLRLNRRDEAVLGLRRAWYDVCGRVAGDMYIAGALIYLHEEYGFGAKRLNRIWEPLSREVRGFFDVFFGVPRDGERELDVLFIPKQKILRECGVHLIEVNSDGEEVIIEGARKGESGVGLDEAFAPEEYSRILNDVKRGWR